MRTMGEIANTIKRLSIDAYDMQKPVQFLEARVLQVSPLSIRVKGDKKLDLSGNVLRVAEHLRTHTQTAKIDGESKEIEFQSKINAGDRVMIASVQGGQSVFVLDKF